MRSARITAILFAILLAIPTASPAGAAGSATIEGRVELGPKGTPLEGVRVSLNRGNVTTGQGDEGIATTSTDAGGRFTFTGVEAGDDWQHDVTVVYRDVTYFSDAIETTAGETTRTEVTVYETTDSDGRIATGQWIVYLDPDSSGGMAVEQDVTFVNTGEETFTGKEMAPGAPGLTAQLPIAPTANPDSIETDGLFNLYEGGTVGSAYGTTAPIVPGVNQAGTLRYVTVPTPLSFPISFPTKDFILYVAPGITVTTSGLTPQGQQSLPGGGPSPAPVDYAVYSATDLAPGQTLQVQAEGTSGSTRLPAAAVILLALAAVLGLFFLVVRLRTGASFAGRRTTAGGGKGPKKPKPPTSNRGTKSPRTRKPSAAEHHAPAGEIDDAEEEVDLLIAEIAALDESFAQGLIDEDDYRRIRTARKEQLRRVGGSGR